MLRLWRRNTEKICRSLPTNGLHNTDENRGQSPKKRTLKRKSIKISRAETFLRAKNGLHNTERLLLTTLATTFTTMAATFACDFACDFHDFDHDFFEKFFKRLYDYYDYWIAWKLKNTGIRSVKKYDKIRRYLIRRRCSVIRSGSTPAERIASRNV